MEPTTDAAHLAAEAMAGLRDVKIESTQQEQIPIANQTQNRAGNGLKLSSILNNVQSSLPAIADDARGVESLPEVAKPKATQGSKAIQKHMADLNENNSTCLEDPPDFGHVLNRQNEPPNHAGYPATRPGESSPKTSKESAANWSGAEVAAMNKSPTQSLHSMQMEPRNLDKRPREQDHETTEQPPQVYERRDDQSPPPRMEQELLQRSPEEEPLLKQEPVQSTTQSREPPPRKKTRLNVSPPVSASPSVPIAVSRIPRQASQRATAALAAQPKREQEEQDEEEEEEEAVVNMATATEEEEEEEEEDDEEEADEESDDEDFVTTRVRPRSKSRARAKSSASSSRPKASTKSKARPKGSTRAEARRDRRARDRRNCTRIKQEPVVQQVAAHETMHVEFVKVEPGRESYIDDDHVVGHEEDDDDDVYMPEEEEDDTKVGRKVAPPMVHPFVGRREESQERKCFLCNHARILCSLFHCVQCRRVYHARCLVQNFSHLFNPQLPIASQWDQVAEGGDRRLNSVLRCFCCREAFRRFMEKPGYAWTCECPTCKNPASLLAYRRQTLLTLLGKANLPVPLPEDQQPPPDNAQFPPPPPPREGVVRDKKEDPASQRVGGGGGDGGGGGTTDLSSSAPPSKKQRVDQQQTTTGGAATLERSMQQLQIRPRVQESRNVVEDPRQHAAWQSLAKSLDQVEVEVINANTLKFPVMCSATADMQDGGKCKEGTCFWTLKSLRSSRTRSAQDTHLKPKIKQKVTCDCCSKKKTIGEFVQHTDMSFDAETRAYEYVFVKRHDNLLTPLKPVLEALELLRVASAEELVNKIVQISENRVDGHGGVIAVGRALDQCEIFCKSEQLYMRVVCKTPRITKLARLWFWPEKVKFGKGYTEVEVECACCQEHLKLRAFVAHADPKEEKEVGKYAWQTCLFVIKRKTAWRPLHVQQDPVQKENVDSKLQDVVNLENEKPQANESTGEQKSGTSTVVLDANHVSIGPATSSTTSTRSIPAARTTAATADSTEHDDFLRLWDSFNGWEDEQDKLKIKSPDQVVKKRAPRPKEADDLELRAVLLDLERKSHGRREKLYHYLQHRLLQRQQQHLLQSERHVEDNCLC